MRIDKLILLLLSFLFSFLLHAQSKHPLVTDRPDQTESSVVVPLNTFQIESGFLFQKQRYSKDSIDIENENLLIGSTLIRYGVSELFELRFGAEYFSGKSIGNGRELLLSGIQGIFIGSKIQLWQNQKLLTNAAIIINLKLPYGNEKLRPERFEPGLIVTVTQNLGEQISLGINMGVEDNSFESSYGYLYSAALGLSISEKLNAFFEFYGDFKKGIEPVHFVDIGLTYLHMNNLQIDFSGGTILSERKVDWFGSIGFSVRLPE